MDSQTSKLPFNMIHRSATRMTHVDALSRIIALVDEMPIERQLEFKQLHDPAIKSIIDKMENSESDKKFELHKGLLFRKNQNNPLFVVPENMVNNIIHIYYDNIAHCGLEKTVQGISSNYWFPSLRKRVKSYIDNCLICLMANPVSNSREGEMQITDTPSGPFQIIHIDHFGPINESDLGFKHILIVIDAFTWLFSVKSTSSKEAIRHLSNLFHTCGNPELVVSD